MSIMRSKSFAARPKRVHRFSWALRYRVENGNSHQSRQDGDFQTAILMIVHLCSGGTARGAVFHPVQEKLFLGIRILNKTQEALHTCVNEVLGRAMTPTTSVTHRGQKTYQ